MSGDAKILLLWINSYNQTKGSEAQSDKEYCAKCALRWAKHIINTDR